MKKVKSKKICFIVKDNIILEQEIEYNYFAGFSYSQKQKCIQSLHESINNIYPNLNILEVSTKSENIELGVKLSAFNLKINGICIEDIFQNAKVFLDMNGNYVYFDDIKNNIIQGKYCANNLNSKDKLLLEKIRKHLSQQYNHLNPKHKKQLIRIYLSLNCNFTLDHFYYNGKKYPNVPLTLFYDYIYIKALVQSDINIDHYDIFTDIEFGKYSINCQARSCAIYKYLCNNRMLNKYINTIECIIDFDKEKEQFNIIKELYNNMFKKINSLF